MKKALLFMLLFVLAFFCSTAQAQPPIPPQNSPFWIQKSPVPNVYFYYDLNSPFWSDRRILAIDTRLLTQTTGRIYSITSVQYNQNGGYAFNSFGEPLLSFPAGGLTWSAGATPLPFSTLCCVEEVTNPYKDIAGGTPQAYVIVTGISWWLEYEFVPPGGYRLVPRQESWQVTKLYNYDLANKPTFQGGILFTNPGSWPQFWIQAPSINLLP